MSAKIKALRAPTMIEVGLGALLSVLLGVVLGAAYLVLKPVVKAKEVPKDPPSGTVYFIEGSRDFSRTEDAEAMRKTFAGGESVSFGEGELNALLGASDKPDSSPSKPDKGAPPPEAKAIDVGTLNARIHAGKIQFADTVSFNVFGITGSVIVQAVGEFDKSGSGFEFVPDSIYVGGCPVERLPVIKGLVLRKLLFSRPVPDDIAAAWPKLVNVSIDDSTMHLRMP